MASFFRRWLLHHGGHLLALKPGSGTSYCKNPTVITNPTGWPPNCLGYLLLAQSMRGGSHSKENSDELLLMSEES
jgi:hypothetical protein